MSQIISTIISFIFYSKTFQDCSLKICKGSFSVLTTHKQNVTLFFLYGYNNRLFQINIKSFASLSVSMQYYIPLTITKIFVKFHSEKPICYLYESSNLDKLHQWSKSHVILRIDLIKIPKLGKGFQVLMLDTISKRVENNLFHYYALTGII